MMKDLLLKPIKNMYVRGALFIIALALFMYSGLIFAAGTAAGSTGDWKLALPVMACGGLLFYKAL